MDEKTKKRFDTFFLIYFIIGACCQAGYLYVHEWFMAILVIYILSIVPVTVTYLIYIVFLCSHKKRAMNIIDGVLCYTSIGVYIPPFYPILYLMDKCMEIYVLFSVCFILVPMIFAIIERKRMQKEDLFIVITRISMVISIHFLLLMFSK